MIGKYKRERETNIFAKKLKLVLEKMLAFLDLRDPLLQIHFLLLFWSSSSVCGRLGFSVKPSPKPKKQKGNIKKISSFWNSAPKQSHHVDLAFPFFQFSIFLFSFFYLLNYIWLYTYKYQNTCFLFPFFLLFCFQYLPSSSFIYFLYKKNWKIIKYHLNFHNMPICPIYFILKQ